jgi:hypothetical protein
LVVIVALLRGTTCLGGSISDINSKKRINISSFLLQLIRSRIAWVLVALMVFLARLRSCCDSDLSFTVIYTAKIILFFKALVLIIISRRLLFLIPRMKISIISWNLNFRVLLDL